MDQPGMIAETVALWPRLATAAGLSPVLPPVAPLHYSTDARATRLVLAFGAGDKSVILKREVLAERAKNDHFIGSVAAQKTAHLRLSGNLQGLLVPKVLAVLPDEGAVLMQRLGGVTAASLIESAAAKDVTRATLAACGAWLGEFHRASRDGRRPYQTSFVMDHFRSQRAAVAAGRIGMAEPALYLALSRSIEAVADSFDGLPAIHAQRHGDYNLRNVLIDKSATGAIDFAPERSAPVGHDIVRLLVDYVTLYGNHSRIPPGQLLKRNELMAFLKPYQFTGPQDAALGFLMNTQLLAEWAKIPDREDKRTLIQALRLQGLVETALRMFPNLRAT